MTTTPCQIGDLAPEARAALDTYLGAVGRTLDADLRDAVVCDLRTWMLDHLDRDSTADDVRALADEAGPVDERPDATDDPDRPDREPLAGTWFGIPYDLRRPTWRKVARALWEPADPTVWRPHIFGAGWTPNFGAVAVRLGLIEPDAEDVPFTSTPRWAFAQVAAYPAGMAAATILHYAVRGRDLPETLPSHWAFDGTPDAWVPKRRAAATDLALTVVPAAAAGWAALSSRPGPTRAGVLGAACGAAAVGATMTVVRPLSGRRPWIGPALVLGLAGAVGGSLFALALTGRAAERRHDLGH